jgi:hypothetical protein
MAHHSSLRCRRLWTGRIEIVGVYSGAADGESLTVAKICGYRKADHKFVHRKTLLEGYIHHVYPEAKISSKDVKNVKFL